MPTDHHAFLRSRRSIRRFKPDPVPESVIREILVTAGHAPSAHNRQPWRFDILTEPQEKTRLALAMGESFRRDLASDGLPSDGIRQRIDRSRARIESAPLVVVLSLDESEMDDYPDERRSRAESIMAVQSCANAGLQLLLAAHAEGLGGVWVCAPLFAPEAVAAVLGIPTTWRPQALFLIGYPLGQPTPKPLKPFEEIVHARPH